ncbi:hypothetical protein [Burkholderia territorii]|uniref:hypothetical protein n=1 Tax=Burkholderia territorii TaxID=1503055 RepID=UPI000B05AC3C|nr:hypothetical protein [Burkholderia territorii]
MNIDGEQERDGDTSIDVARVGIEVRERIVTSSDKMGSPSERRLAFDAACSAPYTRDVADQLAVA